MPGPATIVFDLDGTLVDTAPDLVRALNHAIALEGAEPISIEETRSMIGAGARALLARGLSARRRNLPDERFEELHRAFLDHYEAHIADHSRPFDGTLAALDRLRDAGYGLAICTNKIERLAKKLVGLLDLDRYFRVVVGGDSYDKQKPDPKPLMGAIGRAGGNGLPAILVGDSATDLWTAQAAGIPLIGVTFGYTDVPMAELGPDRLISDYGALDEAVDGLLGGPPARG
jgi:phosphoglycolate phosphatase